MRCEEVRPLLAELAEGEPRPAGPVQVHLAGCAACSSELRRYRTIILGLSSLREELVEAPNALLARVLSGIHDPDRRRLLGRVVGDERVQHAALSLGGAVVGAAAVGALWWRATHRRAMLRPG